MNQSLPVLRDTHEAVRQLNQAAEAKKCWSCGCLHSSLEAIHRAIPEHDHAPELQAAIAAARQRLAPVRYDCLGCEICYPPLAMNALNIEGEACPTESVEAREGWPPLPGSYTVLRYQAPVAICTLADETLASVLASQAGPELALVGTCQTENLGIERIIHNLLANPNIRFLILAGSDSMQAIGHRPGQSLMALAQGGVDERQRIIGAKGKRPVLRNVSPEAVEHFRRMVEVVDLVGTQDVSTVLAAVADCAARDPGPAEPFAAVPAVAVVPGYIPERMISDPSGYFVVYLDRPRRLLSLEHYDNRGVLSLIVEGRTAAELYVPAVERRLLSRLDHAAYLGRELARAERALATGEEYVQDAAPERQSASSRPTPAARSCCGCGSSLQAPLKASTMNNTCCEKKPVGHKLLAIVGQGFEELELAPYTDLAGWTRILDGMPAVSVTIAGFHEIIRSHHGLGIVRDLSIESAAAGDWDGLIIPGGWPGSGYDELYCEPVLSLIRRTYGHGGVIATSCSGIFAVGEAGLLRGKRATTYVSPGGCSYCTTNGERLASYGAVVCDGPLVSDGRILSDIGPAVGVRGAMELFRHFIGDEGISRVQRELRGGLGVSEACCSSKESQP